MYSSSEAAYSEYQEQGKGMTETLPPSYDVVVGAVPPAGSGTPSAPPLSQIPASETPLMSAHQGQTGYDGRGHTQQQSRRTSQADSAKPGCSKRGVEGYVKFSLAHTLRMNLEPDPTRQDPELDVEAQFSRNVVRRQKRVIANKMRLQCVSGWLWCLGVILVLGYIGVPVGMIITGFAGINECPYRKNSLIGYLIGGGILLGVTLLFRSIPSVATIGKNHNWCRTRNSSSCSGGICAFEVLFYIILAINVIVIILGSYWTFDGKPPFECPRDDPDCSDYCQEGVYVGAVIFLILQYALYVITPVYMCITISCNYWLRKQELE
jgi:hypothetical protein